MNYQNVLTRAEFPDPKKADRDQSRDRPQPPRQRTDAEAAHGRLEGPRRQLGKVHTTSDKWLLTSSTEPQVPSKSMYVTAPTSKRGSRQTQRDTKTSIGQQKEGKSQHRHQPDYKNAKHHSLTYVLNCTLLL